jgi:hypothetical protein
MWLMRANQVTPQTVESENPWTSWNPRPVW